MSSSVAMIRRSKRKRSIRPAWTDALSHQYKELSSQLENQGFIIRREELKRGHCWKVVSGSCRSFSERLIFVDSRLSPEEQVAFLSSKLVEIVGGTDLEKSLLTDAA